MAIKKRKGKTAKKAAKRRTTKRKATGKTKKRASKKTARKRKTTRKTKRKTAKKASRKGPAKRKATKKKTKRKGAKRKPNPAFMKPLTPSSYLSQIIGNAPLPRTQVVKKLWAYIKKHNLQDSKNRRNINADSKLRPIFGKSTVSMFEMTKLLSKHLK